MEVPFSDPAKHAVAVEDICLISRVLTDAKIPFWLANGTLLGAVRDNDFISHDSDIDIGVWLGGVDDYDIVGELTKFGFKLLTAFGQSGQPGRQLAFSTPGGVYFDVFFFVEEGDYCWQPLWVGQSFKRMVLPRISVFTPIVRWGSLFYIPENYEDVLTANYGDWRKPEPNWSWCDSPRNLR